MKVGKLTKALQQVCHFNRAHGGIEALVAHLGAGAFDGLLERIRGDDSVRHRSSGLKDDLRDAFIQFRGDIFEMWRAAAYYRSQADESVIFTRLCHFKCY